jgi:dienelactone hydrolase
MKQALPAPGLEAAWKSLERDLGAPRAFRALGKDEVNGADRRSYELTHERGTIEARLFFKDDDVHIAGFFLVKKRVHDDQASKREINPAVGATEVTFGTAPFSIQGTVTYPKSATRPSPALLLVAGSGPQDRDETIGPNRPFRDIAEGLSARGVIVLRYDKRTYAHPDEYMRLQDANVDKEVVDDAVEALSHLRGFAGVDTQRIFVAGHSLGAFLAPEIGARSGQVAGLILLGVPGRPLPDVILDQLHRLGAPAADVAAAQEKVKLLSRHQLSPNDKVFGAPASYWWDLERRDAQATAKHLGKPVLLVRGERDFQVTAADQDSWEKALGKQAQATTLPGLSHFFTKASANPTPRDYQVPGQVDPALLDLVASFVTSEGVKTP